jgi:hypothetical protein
MSSFFGAPSFRMRTESDIKIDEFYAAYGQLLASRDTMSPEEVVRGWDELRERYPFGDVLLIGKRGGVEKDAALAYNTFGRLPPGALSDLSVMVGITPEMLSRFYDQKGSFVGWTPQDYSRFTAGVTELAALARIPDSATRQKYTQARLTYANMNEAINKKYGEGSTDLMSRYLGAEQQERDRMNRLYPKLQEMLDLQNAMRVENPILAQYYGGIDAIERYYYANMFNALEQKYGKEITIHADEYTNLKELGLNDAAKLVYDTYKLKEYFAAIGEAQKITNAAIAKLARHFEDVPILVREDFIPKSESQKGLVAKPSLTKEAVYAAMDAVSAQLVRASIAGGDELNYTAREELEDVAEKFGMSLNEMIQFLMAQP